MVPAQLLSRAVPMGTDPCPQPFHFRYQSFAIELGEVVVHSEPSSKLRARAAACPRPRTKTRGPCSPAAGLERDPVEEPPVLPGLTTDTVEPARVGADAPVLVDRHLDAATRVHGQRHSSKSCDGAVRLRPGRAVLFETDAGSKIRPDPSDARQIADQAQMGAQRIQFLVPVPH